MRWIVLALVISLGAVEYPTYPVSIDDLYVYDGDTTKVAKIYLGFHVGTLETLGCRIAGVNTPEVTGDEAGAGKAVRDVVAFWYSKAKTVSIQYHGSDKFGDRFIGDVIFDGHSLSQRLLDAQLAKPYDGKSKKPRFDEAERSLVLGRAMEILLDGINTEGPADTE